MNVKIKKNLWWLISSIALAIPIVLVINELSVKLGEKLLLGIVSYLILLVICAIVGIIANKIRKVLLKIIWIILGFIGTLFYILSVCIILAMFEPVTDEDISAQEESYRDMVHREFEADNYLDEVVGIELPKYEIVASECTYASMFPTETEYDVELNIYFPDGLSTSTWDKIHKLASEKAPNVKYNGYVINKWDFDEDNTKQIVYQWENSSNVGCIVTFKPKCDTVFVTRYKW
jgi:energy-coupling factor transporter transmembrane protein EcfT